MQKSKSVTILSNVIAVLLPILLLLGALYFGQKETKIPPQLSMRYDEFDFGLFNGVEKDIKLSGDFNFLRDVRTLLSSHMDPFFILAVLLPTGAAPIILWLGYFLRFGIASLLMKRLLEKQIELRVELSCLLGVIYSLSSPVIMLSSYSCAMDVLILIPLFIDRLVEFYKHNYRVVEGIIVSVILGAMLIVSGDMSLLYVLPFAFVTMVFIAEAVKPKQLRAVGAIICVCPYLILGVLIGSSAIVNSFVSSSISIDKEQLLTFDVRSTMFDTLTRFLDGKPLGTGKFSPSLSLTIFILLLLVAFLINSKIPLRVRISLLVITILYHFSFASRAWYRFSIVFESKSIPSDISSDMRFVLLSALLVFAAAISLKNIYLLNRKILFACAGAILIFVIISNNSKVDNSPSLFSVYFSAAAVIISYLLIANLSRPKSALIAAVVVMAGIMLNLSFILPISSYKASMDDDSEIFDSGLKEVTYEYPFEELDFFNKNVDEYVLLHNYTENNYNEIEELNYIINSTGNKSLFAYTDMRSFFSGGRIPLIDGAPMEESEGKVESYVNVYIPTNDIGRDVVCFVTHKGEVTLELTIGDVTTKKVYEGPFIIKLDEIIMGDFQAKFLIPRGAMSNPNDKYEFFVCRDDVLAAFREEVKPLETSFQIPSATDGTTVYTVLTGRTYDKTINVTVNGYSVETMNIHGKLAFPVNALTDSSVIIETSNTDLIICFSIALFCILCSIVVMVYFEKKGKTNENN